MTTRVRREEEPDPRLQRVDDPRSARGYGVANPFGLIEFDVAIPSVRGSVAAIPSAASHRAPLSGCTETHSTINTPQHTRRYNHEELPPHLLTAGALAAAALGLTETANAAPTARRPSMPSTSFAVIVTVSAPLRWSSARSTRFARARRSRTPIPVYRAGDDLVPTVTSKTVYVDISC